MRAHQMIKWRVRASLCVGDNSVLLVTVFQCSLSGFQVVAVTATVTGTVMRFTMRVCE
jgi:hypothetical protein